MSTTETGPSDEPTPEQLDTLLRVVMDPAGYWEDRANRAEADRDHWKGHADEYQHGFQSMMLACNEERVRADNAEREAERLRNVLVLAGDERTDLATEVDRLRAKLQASKFVCGERERELLELKGSCSTGSCRLHHAHAGPCAIRAALADPVEQETGR